MKKVCLCILIATVMSLWLVTPALAAQQVENIPYDSYTYWLGYSNKTLVPSKHMYEVCGILTGNDFGYSNFLSPTDICTDMEGNLYIVEEYMSRLTILDQNGNLKKTISEIKDGDESLSFVGSQGVFVDRNGRIYIADTRNSRVLVSDQNGSLLRVVEIPDSPLIPDDFLFTPVKIVVDSLDNMYVLSKGSTYGALMFGSDGIFLGFYGANTTAASITDIFNILWDLFVLTDEMRQGQLQRIPYQFVDLDVDTSDFVYTVTGKTEKALDLFGQIRRLNPSGRNILQVKQYASFSSSDSFNFLDAGASFVGNKEQNLVGITVDETGYIYALDNTYGRVFVYDKECNLLTALGGGGGQGSQQGLFESAVSIDVYQDKLFVLDYAKAQITVFKETEYGSLVKLANKMYLEQRYEEAEDLWYQVLAADRNSQLAYRGLARSSLMKGDYSIALTYAKQGRDYNTYDQAFGFVRNESLKNNVIWIVLLMGAFAAAVVALVVLLKKKKVKITNEKTKVMLQAPLHPFRSMDAIKYKKQGSILYASFLLFLLYVFTVMGDTHGGFLHNRFDASTYNAIFTLLSTVGIAVLWSICYWAVSVLFEGKSRLKEVYIVTGYAMIPQILNAIFFLIFSQFLLTSEATILSIFSVIMIIMSAIILCIGTMIINEFNFFKFLGTSIVSVIAMGIVIFIIFMILILIQQTFSFVATVFMEFNYR